MLLLKGHRPHYFLCLLLSTVATRNRAAAVCLCRCFAAHQVLGPGVAPFLLLFSCIPHLSDGLAGSILFKNKIVLLLLNSALSPRLKKLEMSLSIAEDEGYLAGYFIKGSSLTGRNPSMAAPTDLLSDTIQLILSLKKRLCVGVNRITSRLMCCYGGSVSLPLMDSLVSDYQTEMRCYDVCSVTSVLIHTLVRSSRRRNHQTL